MEDLERYECQDEGCDLFPSCLNCPFPRCRYDEPRRRHMGKALRNEEMLRLYREGLKVERIAQRFGVSKRTVYRIINGESRGAKPL